MTEKIGKIVDPSGNIPDDIMIHQDGYPVRVTDRDTDTVIFQRISDGSLDDEIGSPSSLVPLDAVPLSVGLGVLRALNGWNPKRHPPKLYLVVGSHWFTRFAGRLCKRFYKKRGYKPHYAPIYESDALELVEGRLTLRYIKSSNRFHLVDPKTPLMGRTKPEPKPEPDPIPVSEQINWWMVDGPDNPK